MVEYENCTITENKENKMAIASAITTYYMSDPHFYSDNATSSNSAKEYNQKIVDTINSIVRQCDKLYILGDIGSTSKISRMTLIKLFSQLKCKHIYILKGNHDSSSALDMLKEAGLIVNWDYFKSIKDRAFGLQVPVGLSHYPSNDIHGAGLSDLSLHIHGHSHGMQKFRMPNQFEVCWDVVGKPVALEELLSKKFGHHANPYEGFMSYVRTFMNEYEHFYERMEHER